MGWEVAEDLLLAEGTYGMPAEGPVMVDRRCGRRAEDQAAAYGTRGIKGQHYIIEHRRYGRPALGLIERQTVAVNEVTHSKDTEGFGGEQKAWLGQTQSVGCKQKFLLQRYGEGHEQKARSESWKGVAAKREETSSGTGSVGGQPTVC